MEARALPIALLAAALAGCGGGGGGGGVTGGAAASALVVDSVDPPDGAVGVDPSAPVVLRFRTPMDEATLTGGALILSPAGSIDPVGSTIAVSLTGTMATVTPIRPLDGGRPYQVRLSALARRADGRSLRKPWYSGFETRASTPPPPPPPESAGTVSAAGNLHVGRSGHAAVLLADGRVAVAGGFSASDAVTGGIEVYSPATNAWTVSATTLGTARGRLTATLLADGRVLLAGGETTSGTDVGTDAWEIWDPSTDVIAASGTLAERRTHHRAVRLGDGKVLLCGGSRTDSSGAPNYSRASAEILDPSTLLSTPTASMSVARAGHEATLLTDGRVLVTGGHGSSVAAEVFDPSAGTWSAAGTMSLARRDHTATALLDGSVLVAGGGTYATDLWLPAQNGFLPMQNMGDARSLQTAVRIADGRVFIAGGEKPAVGGGTTFHNSTEIYNPPSYSWQFPDLPLRTTRSGHTATLLANGVVLVVGGKNGILGAPALRSCDRVTFQ